MEEKITAIIVAAGSGSRAARGKNKIFTEIGGVPCLKKTVSAFKNSGITEKIIVAAKSEEYSAVAALLGGDAEITEGGATRTESVKNALKQVSGGVVLIHDAARPFVTERIIKDCALSAEKSGSGVAAIPARDTIVRQSDEDAEYLGKDGLYLIQTPQAFRTEEIKAAYVAFPDKTFNDDGEAYKAKFGKITLVAGDVKNVKLTYPEDFVNLSPVRFGTGFDCHRLTAGRKLILGGMEIPHDKGLLGHSDADVLTHAIMDAILSACSMRDIGFWFPDSDEKYKGADSMELLKKVLNMIKEKGFKTESVTAVIMAEKPKLSKFIPEIAQNLARALGVPKENVGLTATTLEGLGFVGREEGICVHANAVVKQL